MGREGSLLLIGFFWGSMLTVCAYAYIDYLSSSNDNNYKEKSLIELQIQLKKIEIKKLNKEC